LTRRVYVPNRAVDSIEEAKKLLYLMKTAVTQESTDKILARIDEIRRLLNDASEKLSGST